MINPREMTPDRWISLLKCAGVTDVDDIVFVEALGPVVIPTSQGGWVGVLTPDHLEWVSIFWDDIRSKWKEEISSEGVI